MIFAHCLSPEVSRALAEPDALRASPTFLLRGVRTRGQFAARRLTRALRSDDFRARAGARSRQT